MKKTALIWSIVGGSVAAVVAAVAIVVAVLNPASTPDPTEPTPGPKPVLVEQISVSAEKSEIYIGDSLQLSAAVLPENAENKAVIWSLVSGSECATISETGLLTAMTPGQVLVRADAKDGSGVYGEFMLNINQLPMVSVQSITLSADKSNVDMGKQLSIRAEVLPIDAENKSLRWEIVSGAEFAEIDGNGVLTGKVAGSVTVRATAQDSSGVFGEITITVNPAPVTNVTSITISGAKDIKIGDTLQLTAAVTPDNATNKGITWSISSGSSYATITDAGKLTAKAAGTVKVKATAKDGSGVSAEVTVKIAAVTVKVTKVTISGAKDIKVGDTLQLTAAVTPDNATNKGITWSISSGSSYATITDAGKLTAKAAGTVKVKATAKDGSGVSAEVTVKITAKTVSVTSVTLSASKTTIYVGDTLQLSVAVKPDNATNKNVTWSVSSGSARGSVDASGKLTAKAAGSVTVKATAKDGSGKSGTITITIKEKALWEGSGTANDPFLIRNLTDLKNLQKVVDKQGYYYRQVADIDCSSMETWITIGTEETPFRHHIDGGGYKISNLCLDGESAALFAWVEDSHFKNMHIVNAHTKENTQTYPNNTGIYPGIGGNTGAFVGYGVGCSFENCTAKVNFKSSNTDTGGLAGFILLKNGQKDLAVNCHVTGTVTGGGFLGGLIGRIWTSFDGEEFAPNGAPDIYVKNCTVDAEVLMYVTGSSENAMVGGLIGSANLIKIDKCSTKGKIVAYDGNIGGLVGYTLYATEITRCSSSMDVTATIKGSKCNTTLGGLVGSMASYATVHDCYATGNIYAPDVGWSNCKDEKPSQMGPHYQFYNPCGSLIGMIRVIGGSSDYSRIEVYNCYATGTVNAPKICEDERFYCHGALVGAVHDIYTVRSVKDKTKKDQSDWSCFGTQVVKRFEDNYNLENLRTYYTPINDYKYTSWTAGLQNALYTMPTHEYVEIITSQELKTQATFEGWDFVNIWKMTANGPALR